MLLLAHSRPAAETSLPGFSPEGGPWERGWGPLAEVGPQPVHVFQLLSWPSGFLLKFTASFCERSSISFASR